MHFCPYYDSTVKSMLGVVRQYSGHYSENPSQFSTTFLIWMAPIWTPISTKNWKNKNLFGGKNSFSTERMNGKKVLFIERSQWWWIDTYYLLYRQFPHLISFKSLLVTMFDWCWPIFGRKLNLSKCSKLVISAHQSKPLR